VMAPAERPMALGDRWHIDGLHLPLSMECDHLLVATDVATKYVILNKSKGETAQAATDLLMEIVTRFGPPKSVTTDQGSANMSHLFQIACHDLAIKFTNVGVKRPEGNGAVERVNKTIQEVATAFCGGRQDVWAQHVREIEYALNTRVSSVTKFTPYELVYGRQPPGPRYAQVIDEEGRYVSTLSEQAAIVKRRINVLEQLAYKNQMEAAGKQAAYHDAHAEHHKFDINDTVWYYRKSSMEKGIASKLRYRWTGPFKIAKVMGPVTYLLEDMEGTQLPGSYHAKYLLKVDG